MKTRIFVGGIFALVSITNPAVAQDADSWTGEGTLTAGYTSGNTETTDIGIGLNGARQLGIWRIKAQVTVDYGDNNGVESRNRWALAGQLDRDLTDRFYVYGRGTYEVDKFSGFDSRFFSGSGVGYKILIGEMTTWSLEGGPGYRRDVIQLTGISEGNIGVRIGSAFAHPFNDAVSFSNDTEWVYSDVSIQLINISAITAKLTDVLAARVSFEVRNESDPLPGRKSIDTATHLSLVFGF